MNDEEFFLKMKEEMGQVCESKAEELRLIGYEQVTGEDVWQCVVSKYKKEFPAIHQVVNDILSLKATSS